MPDRLGAIALAAAFVLAGATDWGLVISETGPTDSVICAKTQESCELAREAIRKGWLNRGGDGIPRDTTTVCRPTPECFSEESNCIAGFNCK